MNTLKKWALGVGAVLLGLAVWAGVTSNATVQGPTPSTTPTPSIQYTPVPSTPSIQFTPAATPAPSNATPTPTICISTQCGKATQPVPVPATTVTVKN